MAATPILNLTTLIDKPTVVIDGDAYELLTVDAFSLVNLLRLEPMGARFDELTTKKAQKKTPLTLEEAQELEALTDGISREILKAPPAVHDRLTFLQRTAICEVFTLLPSHQDRLQSTSSPSPRPGRPISASSSRVSRGSTRASTPRRGSTGSRGGSSART